MKLVISGESSCELSVLNVDLFKELVKSVVILGSNVDNTQDEYSDIDIMIVTYGNLSIQDSLKLGSSYKISKDSFLFYNPICSLCELAKKQEKTIHIIVNSSEDIIQWGKIEKNYLVISWARKHQLLWGKTHF